jgi:hypothetical protein
MMCLYREVRQRIQSVPRARTNLTRTNIRRNRTVLAAGQEQHIQMPGPRLFPHPQQIRRRDLYLDTSLLKQLACGRMMELLRLLYEPSRKTPATALPCALLHEQNFALSVHEPDQDSCGIGTEEREGAQPNQSMSGTATKHQPTVCRAITHEIPGDMPVATIRLANCERTTWLLHLPCVATNAAEDEENDTGQDIGPRHPASYSSQSLSPRHKSKRRKLLLRVDFSELTVSTSIQTTTPALRRRQIIDVLLAMRRNADAARTFFPSSPVR